MLALEHYKPKTLTFQTPPMIIFKGAKVQKEWCEAPPAGVYARASLSGYINAKLFVEYGELFIAFLHKRITWQKNLMFLAPTRHTFLTWHSWKC